MITPLTPDGIGGPPSFHSIPLFLVAIISSQGNYLMCVIIAGCCGKLGHYEVLTVITQRRAANEITGSSPSRSGEGFCSV